MKYTHIPIVNWIDDSYKEYGTIVLVGAISEAQTEQIVSYLMPNGGFIPARLNEAHDLDMNNLHGHFNEMLPPDRWTIKDYAEPGGEPWDEGPFDRGQFIAAMRIASELGWKSDRELKAEKRAVRKAHEAEILADAVAVRAAYKKYSEFDGDDDDNEDLRWQFIEDALALVDKIIGDGEQT